MERYEVKLFEKLTKKYQFRSKSEYFRFILNFFYDISEANKETEINFIIKQFKTITELRKKGYLKNEA